MRSTMLSRVFGRGSLGLGALIIAALPQSGHACAAWLERISGEPVVQFDPFSGQAGLITLDLAVRGTDGAPCRLGLNVVSAREGSIRQTDATPLGSLTYVVESVEGAEFVNQAGNVQPLALYGGQARLRLRVPARQMVGAGDYPDQLTLQLVDLDSGQALPESRLRLPLTIAVPARAEANIAGAVGSFPTSPFATTQMDFGELEQGESRTAWLQVRATKAVSIRIESQNRGQMRRINAASGGGEGGLAYGLQVAGRPVELGAGAQTITGRPPITLDGESYPMVVTITGAPGTLPAGHYQDIVSIDVTPN